MSGLVTRESELSALKDWKPSDDELRSKFDESRNNWKISLDLARYILDLTPFWKRTEVVNTLGIRNSEDCLLMLLSRAWSLADANQKKQIDLNEYFSKIHKIVKGWIFREDNLPLMMAALKNEKVKFLDYFRDVNSAPEDSLVAIVDRVAEFIRHTRSLESFSISLDAYSYESCDRSVFAKDALDKESFNKIAEAFRYNASIEEISLICLEIGDEGVASLFKAIDSNPYSKINLITFAGCGISKKGWNIAKAYFNSEKGKTHLKMVQFVDHKGYFKKYGDEGRRIISTI